MPTIKQLPAATAVTNSDLLPVSQNGLTRSLSVSTLLGATQPTLSLAQGTVLGRTSSGLGGPEAVNISNGLTLQSGAIAATGADHVGFPLATTLLSDDEIIVNSNAQPKRMPASKLRSLFSAGSGVQIDGSGVISAYASSDGVSAQGPKGDSGPPGPAGQGFTFRGDWQAATSYSPYDVTAYAGQSYVATSSFVSGATFALSGWTLMAAQGHAGTPGTQGPPGPTVPATASSIGAVKPGSGLSVAADGTLAVSNLSLPSIAQGGAVLGQLLGWTGTAWGPTPLASGTNYTGSSPISVGAGVISLAQNGATAGQVLAWNGLAWAPQSPVGGASFGNATPTMSGVATAGTSNNAAREDHRHPVDTSRAPLASPAFTGKIILPTWTTSTRPASPGPGTEGFATDTGQRETYTSSGWVQYVRVNDIPAATNQLLGGSSASGSAVAIAIGFGLSLTGNTLSSIANYTLPVASASTLGGVRQGTGITIASDGTINATGTSGVSTFNARSGAVTLALGDVTNVIGTGSSARTNLGLAAVASSGAFSDLSGTPLIPAASNIAPIMNGAPTAGTAGSFARADHVHPSDTSRLADANNLADLTDIGVARINLGLGGAATQNVGTSAGTVAAGNDTRLTGALQATAIPAAGGQLLGGSGTAGSAAAIIVGSGLSLSGGTLKVSSGGAYTLPAASTSSLGGVKSDGNTVQIAADGTLSVSAVPITALTDVSSGNLGGPSLSDADTLNRGGTDYRTTLSARVTLFRKTPAGSRTITLTLATPIATLTALDHDKTVVVSGNAAGTLTVNETITDGFRCQVINHAGSPLSFSGISGLGAASVPNGAACWVTLANSAIEAVVSSNGSVGNYTLPAATTMQIGGIKPDGTTLAASADGTLSVVTVSTHVLAGGTGLAAADEFAVYSNASAADVKYNMGQIASFANLNAQSWTTAVRPALGAARYATGFNTTTSRFEFWNGQSWDQHCRVSDFSATPAQLYAGSSANGVPTPVNVGSGLSLVGNVLSAPLINTGVAPVTKISSSGTAQTLAFPTSGNKAYDVTLTGSCSFALAGGTSGELQTITLVVRGGAGGFAATLPPGIKWPGGLAPIVDTAAGSYNEFYLRTIDGGSTYSGSY